MIKSREIFILFLLISCTIQCHYSCSSCTDRSYSSCTTCPKPQPLLKADGYSSSLIGVCSDININNANILGIFFVLIIIAVCIVFPTEEIIYFVTLMQSLGLLYLVEVLWSQPTHYILSAFTYLMTFSKLNYLFVEFGKIQLFKSEIFFKSPEISSNFAVLGTINLILVVFMIIIPIFKTIRKKYNKQRANCLPDVTLSKILLYINFAYLMLIQETVLNIYFGLKYGQMEVGDRIIVITYFLSLIFFTINQWFYPFPFFRTKFVQFNIILIKTIPPLFIISQKDIHFLVFIYLFIFFSIDAFLTNKNRNNRAINRLFFYKLYGLLLILITIMYYGMEIAINKESTSHIMGIITTLLLCGALNLFAIQFGIEYKTRYCVEQKNERQKQKKMVDTFQITRQELTVQNKRSSHHEVYDFSCLPAQKANPNEEEFQKSNLIMMPLTLIPKRQQDQSSEEQNNIVKLSEKLSTNRLDSLTNEGNRQIVDTNEDIQIDLKQKQITGLAESKLIKAKQEWNVDSSHKRKGKKRRRQQ